MGIHLPLKMGTAPHFSAHVSGQMAGWIKMQFGTEVGLSPGHIALDMAQLPQKGAQHPPSFQPMSIVAKRSPISATAELLY